MGIIDLIKNAFRAETWMGWITGLGGGIGGLEAVFLFVAGAWVAFILSRIFWEKAMK